MVPESSIFVQTKLITTYLDYNLRLHKRTANELTRLYLIIGGDSMKTYPVWTIGQSDTAITS